MLISFFFFFFKTCLFPVLKELLVGKPIYHLLIAPLGFPGGEESTVNAGDSSSIPRLGESPGEGNGNPLQYYCLGNLMDRAWQVTVHGVADSRKQLSE